jgi:hypothetical protein
VRQTAYKAKQIRALGKQSWNQQFRKQLCLFLGFGEGFRVFWGYFNGFLVLFSAILRYAYAISQYFTICSDIFLYFTLNVDSMICYLTCLRLDDLFSRFLTTIAHLEVV